MDLPVTDAPALPACLITAARTQSEALQLPPVPPELGTLPRTDDGNPQRPSQSASFEDSAGNRFTLTSFADGAALRFVLAKHALVNPRTGKPVPVEHAYIVTLAFNTAAPAYKVAFSELVLADDPQPFRAPPFQSITAWFAPGQPVSLHASRYRDAPRVPGAQEKAVLSAIIAACAAPAAQPLPFLLRGPRRPPPIARVATAQHAR